MAEITSLIDGPDNKSVVRDKLAAILIEESAGQVALAIAANRDPRAWRLRVFAERSNPWDVFSEVPEDPLDAPRVVNVSFESFSYDERASNVGIRQKGDALFHLDCFGFGISQTDGAGHIAGDEDARRQAEWNMSLVRRIVMAGQYVQLDLPGLVWTRMPSEERALDVPVDKQLGMHVAVSRLTLKVGFSEYAPQYEGDTIDTISAGIFRTETGELHLTAQYPEP